MAKNEWARRMEEYLTLSEELGGETTVCTRHKRFVPCRPCIYGEPDMGGHWDSTDPDDIDAVKAYQQEGR